MNLYLSYPTEYEYIVPMDDSYIFSFISGPGIKSVENRSKCTVEVCKRVLNRQVGSFSWTKFNIIKVRGPTEASVKMCNKLMERLNPNYVYRKQYDSNAVSTLYTTEFNPDNSNIVQDSQRLGANLNKYKGLTLFNRHRRLTRYPNSVPNDTPWKFFPSHKKGIHYPCQIRTARILHYLQPNLYQKQEPINNKLAGTRQKRNKLISLTSELNKSLERVTNEFPVDDEEFDIQVEFQSLEDNGKHEEVPIENLAVKEINQIEMEVQIQQDDQIEDVLLTEGLVQSDDNSHIDRNIKKHESIQIHNDNIVKDDKKDKDMEIESDEKIQEEVQILDVFKIQHEFTFEEKQEKQNSLQINHENIIKDNEVDQDMQIEFDGQIQEEVKNSKIEQELKFEEQISMKKIITKSKENIQEIKQIQENKRLENEREIQENILLEKKKQIQERRRLEKEKQIQENIRLEKEKKIQENIRLEKEKRIQENRRLENEKRIQENIRLEKEKDIQENIRLEKEKQIQENIRLEKEKEIQENRRLEKEKEFEDNLRLLNEKQIQDNIRFEMEKQIQEHRRLQNEKQMQEKIFNKKPIEKQNKNIIQNQQSEQIQTVEIQFEEEGQIIIETQKAAFALKRKLLNKYDLNLTRSFT